MKFIKKIAWVAAFILAYIIGINFWVSRQAENALFNSIENIPSNRVGLLLGASKYTSNNNVNLYYKYRLEAATALYKAGKIEFILISGDNGRKGYDEPTDFKNDLIKNGIPENKIYLDYAGFRTLDSMVRAKEIFGLNELTIISQKFHNERALYLAKHAEVHAIAFNAKDINGRYGFKTKLREYLARAKASADILFNVKPKFLGKKIDIK